MRKCKHTFCIFCNGVTLIGAYLPDLHKSLSEFDAKTMQKACASKHHQAQINPPHSDCSLSVWPLVSVATY